MNRFVTLLFIMMVNVYVSGCKSSQPDNDHGQGPGRITFRLSLPDRQDDSTETLASDRALIACDDAGIVDVSCEVLASSGQVLASATWPCNQGHGELNGIAASDGLRVVLSAKNINDDLLYRGVREDVTVIAGQTNHLGIIELRMVNNSPPTGRILQPLTADVFNQGSPVTFEGSAEDPEDGAIGDADLVWSSSIDGTIGTGAVLILSDLTAGTHTITLTATDSEGVQGQTEVTLIVNALAMVTIDSPEDGHNRCVGLPILFSGSAVDPEDGDISANGSLRWLSDRDGLFGTGSQSSGGALTQGTHTIILEATDSQGARTTASVQVIIHLPRLADTGQTVSTTTTFGETPITPLIFRLLPTTVMVL